MKAFTTLEEAKRELKKVTSGATGTDIFMAKCFPLMMEMFADAYTRKHRKNKRPPSAWNLFVSEGMKAGLSMKQVAEEWRKNK